MGSPKALLPDPRRPGATLIDSVLSVGAAFLAQFHGNKGDATGKLILIGDLPGYSCIPDEFPGLGPLAGIHAAMRYLLQTPSPERADAVIYLPVDMPDLTAELLHALFEALPSTPSLGVWHFEHCELPMLSWVTPAIARIAERRLAHIDKLSPIGKSDVLSLRDFFDEVGATSVPIGTSSHSSLINLNTPQQFAAWESSLVLCETAEGAG